MHPILRNRIAATRDLLSTDPSWRPSINDLAFLKNQMAFALSQQRTAAGLRPLWSVQESFGIPQAPTASTHTNREPDGQFPGAPATEQRLSALASVLAGRSRPSMGEAPPTSSENPEVTVSARESGSEGMRPKARRYDDPGDTEQRGPKKLYEYLRGKATMTDDDRYWGGALSRLFKDITESPSRKPATLLEDSPGAIADHIGFDGEGTATNALQNTKPAPAPLTRAHEHGDHAQEAGTPLLLQLAEELEVLSRDPVLCARLRSCLKRRRADLSWDFHQESLPLESPLRLGIMNRQLSGDFFDRVAHWSAGYTQASAAESPRKLIHAVALVTPKAKKMTAKKKKKEKTHAVARGNAKARRKAKATKATATAGKDRRSFEERGKTHANHGDNFCYVTWFDGSRYEFSKPDQRKVIEELWKRNGASMTNDDVIVKLNNQKVAFNFRVPKLFKHSPAWGKIIVPGPKRGTYRLNVPKGETLKQ